MGAGEVVILYRSTRDEMPASAEEIEQALVEGVKINFLVTPAKITWRNNRLEMETLRMKLGDIDNSGRRRAEPLPDSVFKTAYDNIYRPGSNRKFPNSSVLLWSGVIRLKLTRIRSPRTKAASMPEAMRSVVRPPSLRRLLRAGRRPSP